MMNGTGNNHTKIAITSSNCTYIKSAFVSLLMFITAVLSGCNNDDFGKPILLNDGTASGEVRLPSVIQSAQLDQTCIRGWITIGGGSRQAMTIANNAAFFSATGIAVGTQTITIEFECIDSQFGTVSLAQADQQVNLVSGQNLVDFTQDMYELLDNDEDGQSNLFELDQRTDPTNPDTTPPQSFASRESGSYTPFDFEINCSDFIETGSGCQAIYYTVDGNPPDRNSPVYGGGLPSTV